MWDTPDRQPRYLRRSQIDSSDVNSILRVTSRQMAGTPVINSEAPANHSFLIGSVTKAGARRDVVFVLGQFAVSMPWDNRSGSGFCIGGQASSS